MTHCTLSPRRSVAAQPCGAPAGRASVCASGPASSHVRPRRPCDARTCAYKDIKATAQQAPYRIVVDPRIATDGRDPTFRLSLHQGHKRTRDYRVPSSWALTILADGSVHLRSHALTNHGDDTAEATHAHPNLLAQPLLLLSFSSPSLCALILLSQPPTSPVACFLLFLSLLIPPNVLSP